MTGWVVIMLLLEVHSGLALPRHFQDVMPENRDLCPETEAARPPNRVYTGGRVARLRTALTNTSLRGGPTLHAYIIHYGDQHLGSVTDYDRRLQYMSGFSGSSGYAAVTATRAALWTDGRYFLQADQQMDCDWTMMKISTAGYPTLAEWLGQQIPGGTVGADPKLVSISNWMSYSETLLLHAVPSDLVDDVWTEGRPARLNNLIHIHNISFAGRTWQDKVTDVRSELMNKGMEAFVVTALDETAWLFNLRGRDRLTSPLFDAYTLLTHSDIRLYIRNTTKLLTSSIVKHLNTNDNGSCAGRIAMCVEVIDYAKIMDHVQELAAHTDVKRILISPNSNYAVFSAAGGKREVVNSPIALMKSIKNPVERENYYKCQVRDSAALIEFAALLEQEMAEGKPWTELSTGSRLTEIRSMYEYNWGVSFVPISSVGANSAVIHYRPDKTTDSALSTSEVYLLDSGGQYQDGTTDVTRTFHFGTPSDEQKEAYTRVLMAHIDLATTVWPAGLKGNDIDARTRAALWERGWDFRHGTGHGIGFFLQVHEGPARLGLSYQGHQYEPLHEGMFFSDEPGFYRDGEYGIRLESIMEIVKADTADTFGDVDYLTFNPATLVPFEPKFILVDLLSAKQRRWYNAYNRQCVLQTGELLKHLGKTQGYDWLLARTAHIPDVPTWGEGTTSSAITCTLNIVITTCTLFMLGLVNCVL